MKPITLTIHMEGPDSGYIDINGRRVCLEKSDAPDLVRVKSTNFDDEAILGSIGNGLFVMAAKTAALVGTVVALQEEVFPFSTSETYDENSLFIALNAEQRDEMSSSTLARMLTLAGF